MSIHIDEEFGPIRVITQDDISKFLEDGRKAALQSNDMYISPLSDESIQGYVGDKVPKWNGVQEIKTVVDILHEAEVLCCMVAEPALIYYGTGRVMTVFTKFQCRLVKEYFHLIYIGSLADNLRNL